MDFDGFCLFLSDFGVILGCFGVILVFFE